MAHSNHPHKHLEEMENSPLVVMVDFLNVGIAAGLCRISLQIDTIIDLVRTGFDTD